MPLSYLSSQFQFQIIEHVESSQFCYSCVYSPGPSCHVMSSVDLSLVLLVLYLSFVDTSLCVSVFFACRVLSCIVLSFVDLCLCLILYSSSSSGSASCSSSLCLCLISPPYFGKHKALKILSGKKDKPKHTITTKTIDKILTRRDETR